LLTEDLAARGLDLSLTSAKAVREIDPGSADTIRLPDAHLMFQGEYRKEGFDLVIEDETSVLIINDYFRAAKRATLESPEGARLTDDIVAALAIADHGERYAQATPPAAQQQIGRVETVSGQATVIRNGAPVVLNQGDPVFKGDVVQTDRGSSLGITFLDGSVFSLGAGARMVLNDMVYQQGGAQNSALLNIVQGSVTFLAGQVAKTGEMRVGTPVATMGIRGTLVGADINAQDGTTKFSVKPEQDGTVGRFELIRDGRVIAVISRSGEVTTVTPTGVVSTQPLTPAEQQADQLAIAIIYQIVSLAAANPLVPGLPTGPGPSGPSGGGGGGSSSPPDSGTTTTPPLAATPPLVQLFGTSGVELAVFTPQPISNPAAGGAGGAGSGRGGGEKLISVSTADGSFPASPNGFSITGRYGTLFVNPDGTAGGYAPRPSLRGGESGTDTFTFQYRDEATGETREETRTFTTTGVNDAPTVAGPVVADDISEDQGTRTVDLLAGATDVDVGATLHVENVTWNGHPAGELPPGFSLSSDGRRLLIDTNSPAYDDLPAGQSRTFSFTYEVVDEFGARTTQAATITVNGTGEPPPVFDGSFETGFTGWERVGTTEVVPGGTSGSQEARITTSSSSSVPFSQIESFLGVPAGSLAIDASASHTSNSSTIGSAIRTTSIRLEAGQTLVFDWNFSTSDYNPYNDFAVFTIDELNAIFELADVESVGNYGTTGWRTFRFTATQSGDYHFGFAVLDTGDGAVASTLLIDNVRVESNGAPVLAGSVAASAAEDSGTASVDLLAGASDPQGTALRVENLDWHNSPGTGLPPGFSLAPDGRTILVDTSNAAFQSLAEGESRAYDFDYEVVDASGARTTQTARITVTGTNDGPVATANANTVTEDAATSGNVLADGTPDSDPDNGDSIQVYGISRASDASGTFTSSGTITSPYGHLVIAPDGSYTYTADGTAAQALAQGATASDTFIYYIEDESGARTSATLTFTINGTNDAPTAPGGSFTRSLDEDTSAAGALPAASDPDTAGPITYTLISGPSHGSASIYQSGSYYYTYTPTSNYEGQDSLTYRVSNASGYTDYTITFDVVGVNDRPTLAAGAPSATLVEDGGAGTQTSTVTASSTDPDAGDTRTFSVHSYRYVGAPGISWDAARAQAIAAGGYLANVTNANENAVIQSLKPSGSYAWLGAADAGHEGDWRWADGPEAGRTFSIGSDIAAGFYANWWGSEPNGGTSENYVYIDAGGFWTDDDALAGSMQGYVIEFSGTTLQGIYGSVSIDPSTGALTYTLDNNRPATQALAQGQTATERFSIVVTDSSGATDTQQVSFTIQGANDAPVGVNDEVRALSTSVAIPEEALLFNDTDVDNGAVLSVGGVTSGSASYGSGTFFASGSFSFSVHDGNGGSATETVSINTSSLIASSGGSVLMAPSSGTATLTGGSGRDVFVVQQSGDVELVNVDTSDALNLPFLKNYPVTPSNIEDYVRVHNREVQFDADGTGSGSWVTLAQADDLVNGDQVTVIWHQHVAVIHATEFYT
jgi:VCBS repeat-containing protein